MKTILLVDDDPGFFSDATCRAELSALGFQRVHSASSFRQAVGLLSRHQVDVLVCSAELPDGGCAALLQWLELHSYPAVTLLTRTGSARPAAPLPCLHKPIEPAALRASLRQALEKAADARWAEAFSTQCVPKRPASPNATIQRIIDYVDEHISSELTREQLGHALYLNPDYLARMFRDQFGQPLNEYIRSRRILHAKWLLRHSELPIPEICKRVGYTYNTYFFTHFKKTTGFTPGEYRALAPDESR